jgi:hypothetical protein
LYNRLANKHARHATVCHKGIPAFLSCVTPYGSALGDAILASGSADVGSWKGWLKSLSGSSNAAADHQIRKVENSKTASGVSAAIMKCTVCVRTPGNQHMPAKTPPFLHHVSETVNSEHIGLHACRLAGPTSLLFQNRCFSGQKGSGPLLLLLCVLMHCEQYTRTAGMSLALLMYSAVALYRHS